MSWLKRAGAGGIGSMHLEIQSLKGWNRRRETLRKVCGSILGRFPRESIARQVMRWPSKPFGAAWPSFAALAMAASNVGSINQKSTWAIPCATSTFV
jgi:hypothetical protein